MPTPYGLRVPPRNPTWTSDELVLALDLYFRVGIGWVRHPEVIALSEILNALPIHDVRPDAPRFRNANSVHLKLANFAAVDPDHAGAGMSSHGSSDVRVFAYFGQRRSELSAAASRLRAWALDGMAPQRAEPDEDDVEAMEGKLLYRWHRQRERDRSLVAKKKSHALGQLGSLVCEVCAFDFAATYGERGAGFIECHHRAPLSQSGETRTKLSDLALVCANCHRIIHRRAPWTSVEALRDAVSVGRGG